MVARSYWRWIGETLRGGRRARASPQRHDRPAGTGFAKAEVSPARRPSAPEARIDPGEWASYHAPEQGQSVRMIASADEIAARVGRMAVRWPGAARIGMFNAFLRDIRLGMGDPQTLRIASSRNAHYTAHQLHQQMMAFEAALSMHHQLRRRLARATRRRDVTPSQARRGQATLREARLLADMLLRNRHLMRRDVDWLIARLGMGNAELRDMLDSAGGRILRSPREHAGADPGDRAQHHDELHQAMRYFGFAIEDRPDRDALRLRFRELARAMHPDAAGTDADAQQIAHARFVALNRHYEVLQRWL